MFSKMWHLVPCVHFKQEYWEAPFVAMCSLLWGTIGSESSYQKHISSCFNLSSTHSENCSSPSNIHISALCWFAFRSLKFALSGCKTRTSPTREHLLAHCSTSSEVVLTNAEKLDWLYLFFFAETIKIPDKLCSAPASSLNHLWIWIWEYETISG